MKRERGVGGTYHMEEMERSRHGVVDFWNVMSLISTAFTGRGSSTELAALGPGC
ncbi:MATE efflux family protein 4 [Pyrus ussuriensis x Pyrus communis]|uniref:MATE efflux family protein 4 n=1 Tax=Pyrus ussuriensis x Pyrus communis TaxID=2448454 RepID=A0A5N5IAP2_9ROSA|nr:MATE efflux family protein 4 [Pyrus ussuriensis x Pyrus communis]